MTAARITAPFGAELRGDRLGQVAAALLIAMPALFVVGQAAADIALTAIGLLFLGRSLRARDWRWLEEPWVLIGLVVWVYLMLNAAYVAEDVEAANSRASPFGRFVVFAAALQFWLFVDPRVRRWFLVALAAVLAFVTADCLLQYATGEDILGKAPPVAYRLTGPFDEKVPGSFLSYLAAPIIALAFRLAAASQKGTPVLGAVAATVLLAITIALTGERAALIMYVFGLLMLFLLLKEARRPLLITGVAGTLFLSATIAAQPGLEKRLIGHTAYDLGKFWERRIGSLVWRGQEVWHDHLLFGVGLKNFRRFCERDDFLPRGPVATRCYTHPHQLWNEWLAETGAVGFAGFLALLALWGRAIVRGLWRLGETYPLAVGGLISLVVILWPLRTSMSFFSNWLAAMFWLMLGLTLALTAPRGRRPSPPS